MINLLFILLCLIFVFYFSGTIVCYLLILILGEKDLFLENIKEIFLFGLLSWLGAMVLIGEHIKEEQKVSLKRVDTQDLIK